MITTAQPVLAETSQILNESSTDTSSKRIGYFNRSVKKVFGVGKWPWRKKKGTLDTDNEVQEYVLTTEFSDYDVQGGIISVWVGGIKILPIDYDRKADVDNPATQKFYLTPDNRSIGFIKTFDGTEDVEIWYFALHTYISSAGESLTVTLPDDISTAIALYMKFLVHDGKRQRYDARNALLDFKEEIDTLRPKIMSSKIKDAPKTVAKLFSYLKHKRVYATH